MELKLLFGTSLLLCLLEIDSAPSNQKHPFITRTDRDVGQHKDQELQREILNDAGMIKGKEFDDDPIAGERFSDNLKDGSDHYSRNFDRQSSLDKEEDSTGVIGAFARLPPPTTDGGKSRRQNRIDDRIHNRLPHRFPDDFPERNPRRFPPPGAHRNSRDRSTGFFNDERVREPNFRDKPNIIHRFPLDTDRNGFDSHHSFSQDRRNSQVGHSIFVNADDNSYEVPRRSSRPFRGEGPIIIHRGDKDRGRPVLVELDNTPRGQLSGSGVTNINSKFGPLVTTIHGAPGTPDIIIPETISGSNGPVADSSLTFHRKYGQRRVPFPDHSLIFHPNSINGRDSLDLIPDSFSSRRPSSRPSQSQFDSPQRSEHRKRISFFPDLGVNIDRPSRIQPEVTKSTDRPTDFRPPNTIRDQSTNRRTQFRFPTNNVNFSDDNWTPSFIQGSNSLKPDSGGGSQQRNRDNSLNFNKRERERTYSYGYTVNAPSTGDHKAVYEERGPDGIVKGQYSFLQPDGYFRKVSYEADAERGFRANVNYIPT